MLLSDTSGAVQKIVQHRGVNSSSPLAQTTNYTTYDYTTAQGSKVDIQLIGPGSLKGTTLDANGDLELVYSGTTVFSAISGTVKGGTGYANVVSIQPANVDLLSLTGIGGDLIGRVVLPSFNLISGGTVNLTSGVQVLTLNSVATDSQVQLRDTPLNTTLGLESYVNTVTGTGVTYAQLSSTSTGATSSSSSGLSSGTAIGVATGQSAGGVTTLGQGTLNPTAVGFGGGAVGAINGAIPIINTVGNGENVLGTPGLTQTQVDQGRTTSYIVGSDGGDQLSTVAGTFKPGANLIVPSDISLPPTHVPPPGVIVTIKHVNGGPTAKTPPLADPMIYGYDATANQLIEFDATTGAKVNTINLSTYTSSSSVAGVSLARNGSELVVLVGIGSTVLAFDANSASYVGQFSTSSLASEGLTTVTGIATANGSTVLSDSQDGSTGMIQEINVAQSLASLNHEAVAVGSPYSPAREFALSGPLTGVPGTGNLFALGSGFFDTAQPNSMQAGILTITPGTTGLTESTRTVLTNSTTGLDQPAGSYTAVGSLNSFLALGTGVVNNLNVFNLYAPNGLTSEGSFTLQDANPLVDLTQSFHPELNSTALIEVQGNIQSFTAKTATGMVLNDAGNLNLLQINNASDSTVIGLPFGHVNIPVRNNVVIVTNSRLVGTRGGVIVDSSATQVGPLFLD